jgi:hypothetical protein
MQVLEVRNFDRQVLLAVVVVVVGHRSHFAHKYDHYLHHHFALVLEVFLVVLVLK